MCLLYRAMSPLEWADIQATHLLGCVPQGMQGKWFATSVDDAERWGRVFYFDWEGLASFFVVEVDAPGAMVQQMHHDPFLDGVGPGYYADAPLLTQVRSINLVSEGFP